MELQILSDLHLESPKAYDFYEIKPVAPYLALLGDIGCVSDPAYLTFLSAQLAQFRIVFHLLGNHEPYGSNWDTTITKLRAFEEENRQQQEQGPRSGVGAYVLLDRNELHLPRHNLTHPRLHALLGRAGGVHDGHKPRPERLLPRRRLDSGAARAGAQAGRRLAERARRGMLEEWECGLLGIWAYALQFRAVS